MYFFISLSLTLTFFNSLDIIALASGNSGTLRLLFSTAFHSRKGCALYSFVDHQAWVSLDNSL